MKTLLEKIVETMPDGERRFIRKQGEIATHIWRIMQSKTPAWSKGDLVRRSGKSYRYINDLLQGCANPTLETLTLLESVLGEDIIVCPSPRRYKELAKKYAKPEEQST